MYLYIWPIALVVLSNIIYQVCSKSVPKDVSPFAVLIVTYLIGAAFAAVMFFATKSGDSLWKEVTKMNWAPYVLGLSVVGLEIGFMYAYKAGWQVSTASIVQSSFLAIGLLIVGFIAYHEALTWNKIIGIAVCMVGLFFINMK